ncbi:unnamed protein product [Sphenostylis stenocarpa]|uniref:Transmembrane protein n=1 Tax=Sphenostylis stenocarpa TaxID=92480 RepID=A0AA87B868_9FABA|nr:unnamed protein product [Sphenostylis stenocarpa]
MEALWDLEDKLKVSTLGAVLLLACASFALVCLCIVVILRRKVMNNKIVHQEGVLDDENENDGTTTNTNTIVTVTATPTEWSEPSCVGWISVKRVLMGSMLWSKASKLEENIAWQRERGSPLLGLQRQGLESGWQSHNSESPVWQRPILRGEKCELPRFSGLILYDEKGRLLRDSSENETHHFMEISQQEVRNVTVRTTLRDLL